MPRLLLSALLVLAVSSARAVELQTVEEIEECIRGNFPESTSVQTIVFRAKDRIGAVVESKAIIYWKKFENGRSKMMIRFFAPPDLRGAGLLMLEEEELTKSQMFIYLPELAKVKRVTSRMISGSMFGMDFSYEDFERLQRFREDSANTRLEDASVDGKATYVVEGRPGSEDGSAYEKVIEYIDKETCLLLKVEMYERGERLRKVMSADLASIAREGAVWVPKRVRMSDLRDETETELVVEEMKIGVDIPRKMFSQRELEAGGR